MVLMFGFYISFTSSAQEELEPNHQRYARGLMLTDTILNTFNVENEQLYFEMLVALFDSCTVDEKSSLLQRISGICNVLGNCDRVKLVAQGFLTEELTPSAEKNVLVSLADVGYHLSDDEGFKKSLLELSLLKIAPSDSLAMLLGYALSSVLSEWKFDDLDNSRIYSIIDQKIEDGSFALGDWRISQYLSERSQVVAFKPGISDRLSFFERFNDVAQSIIENSWYYNFFDAWAWTNSSMGMVESADEVISNVDLDRVLLSRADSVSWVEMASTAATVKLSMRDSKKALELNQRILECYKNWDGTEAKKAATLMQLTNCLLIEGQMKEAQVLVQEAISSYSILIKEASNPEDKNTYLELQAGAYYSLGVAAINNSDYDTLVECHDAVSSKDIPESDVLRIYQLVLGAFKDQNHGNIESAIEKIDGAIDLSNQIDPSGNTAKEYAVLKAVLQTRIGSFEKALQNLSNVSGIYNESSSLHLKLTSHIIRANAFGLNSELEKQASELQKAQILFDEMTSKGTIDEATTIFYCNEVIRINLTLDQYDVAKEVSDLLITLTPLSSGDRISFNVHYTHTSILMYQGKYEQALESSYQLIDASKGFAELEIQAYFMNSRCHLLMSDNKSAIRSGENYRATMEKNPDAFTHDWIVILKSLAELYQTEKSFETSVEVYRTSREFERRYLESQSSSSRDYLDERVRNINYDDLMNYSWLQSDFIDQEWFTNYRLWSNGFVQRVSSSNSRVSNLYAGCESQISGLKREMRRLEDRSSQDSIRAIINQIEAFRNDLGDIDEGPTTAEELRNHLSANECFVDLVQYSSDTRIGYFAILFTSNDLAENIIPLGELDSVKDSAFFREVNLIMFPDSVINKKTCTRLYDIIWNPLKEALVDFEKVYWSGSVILAKLSPAILYNSSTERYVIDDYNIIMVTDPKELATQYPAFLANDEVTLIGNPNFGGEVNKGFTTFSFLERNGSVGNWLDLSGTGRELSLVDSLFTDAGFNTELLAKNQATEDNFLDINSPKYVVVATHGFFLNEEPDIFNASGLVFSDANNNGKSDNAMAVDNYVTSAEIMDIDLSTTQLVVLSACQSAQGQGFQSENYNLVRAFKIAGAQNVMASGWSVSDKKTVEFMGTFFGFVTKGIQPEDAFSLAQRQMKDKYPNPYAWGVYRYYR
jgi:CHAT domain-containing protein